MRLLLSVLVVISVLAGRTANAESLDLLTAYKKATEYDAKVKAARADNKMFKEEIIKAKSQLLPNARISASRGRNATEFKRFGVVQSVDFYNTVSLGVSVRQPILNLTSVETYKLARHNSEKSDLDLKREELSLMVRVAEAYCNVLFADDTHAFSQAMIEATDEQLRQARMRYKRGFGTVPDVEEAKAAYDNAVAEGIDIKNNRDYTRFQLQDLTGIYPDTVLHFPLSGFALQQPDPVSVDVWIERALAKNTGVLAARQDVMIAKGEITKQRVARYPTIDLVAGRNYSESENNYSIGSIYDTYSIALQLSVPTYTGGYISASVRQAQAKWLRAGEQLTLQEREIESEVRKYFNGVNSNIAQIKAFEQAVKSRELALTGMEKGYEAGFRSNLEVLDAQQKLFASRRNLAKARYQYILNRLMLKQIAGELYNADIEEVNSWLFRARS